MQKVMAFILLFITAPLWPVLYLAVKLDSKGPFIFKQKRTGKNHRPFTMYKIRTMVEGAEKLKSKYQKQNEADGPVFKIRNDPRYTKMGKILSHLGADELPQLINVIKGEMAIVGPRPLPTDEAAKVPKKYHARFKVLPGITSTWVIEGSHSLKFAKWMELDAAYSKQKSLWYDARILAKTALMIAKQIFSNE